MLLQKMELISKTNDFKNKAFYFNVQGVQDKTEIADVLLTELRSEQNSNFFKATWNNCKRIYGGIRPQEITIKDITFRFPEFKTKWKEALSACLEDIADRKNSSQELITLILDEFPMMLWNWIENGKGADAMELLDMMRNIRQSLKEKGNIRFVICGSIGLKVVLDRLRDEFRYTGEPFNDTWIFSVEAMTKKDAEFLCECLVLSGFTHSENKENQINSICDLTECLPYYINKLFTILHLSYGGKLSDENITNAYYDMLTHPDYSEVFDQLHTRLTTYYQGKAATMQQVLDIVSQNEEWQEENNIISQLNNHKEDASKSLERLVKERYLEKKIISDKRHYKFKYQLFRKWWRLNKA